METTMNDKPRWFFYPGWVVLNAITIVLSWYIAWALIALVEEVVGDTIRIGGQTHITEDFLFLYVLFPIIGLLTGSLQYALLRRYLPRMGWWIPATLVGWTLLLLMIGFIVTPLLVHGNSTFLVMLATFLIGTSIALPQWWMLHQRVRRAFWWILAYAIGWWLIGLLNLVTSDPFPVLIAIALIPTIGTSVACWLLLDWLPKHELEKATLLS